MKTKHQVSAFTLIELMVVVGIIGLLIAIVLPAVGAARDQARSATTRATITAIETGVQQFYADHLVGGAYPPSQWMSLPVSPHGTSGRFEGANFVAWAVVGADLQGTPGFRDLNGNGVWQDDIQNLYAINTVTKQPALPRSGPYVEISKMEFPKPQTGTTAPFFIESNPQAGPLNSICFLDSFDQPILYYRANEGQGPMVGMAGSPGIYNFDDNALITGTGTGGMDLGGGAFHFPQGLGPTVTIPATGDRGTFAYAVHNPDVTALARPHRPDSFILISPGPDAVYGTADDLANFKINK